MASEIKPICGLERVKLANVVPLKTPFSLFVFPTTYCNFKCIYCGHSLGQAGMKDRYGFQPQHMRMETFDRVIEQAKEFPDRFKMLSLTGHGEPLMNQDLSYMIEVAKKAKIAERIEIITNASLLTRDLSKSLIESGLDTIRISLQGLSSEKYSQICGYKLNFEEFIENIRYFYLNKKQCNVFVKVMDIALEDGEEEQFYNLFSDISDRMYIEQCRPVYDGVKYNNQAKDLTIDRYGRTHTMRQVCPIPFFMLGVFPDGDVEPCDTIYKPIVLGNIHQDRMLDLWNGKKLKDFWRMQLQGKRKDNVKCLSCCAPDDIAHPEDVLDDDADRLLKVLDCERV